MGFSQPKTRVLCALEEQVFSDLPMCVSSFEVHSEPCACRKAFASASGDPTDLFVVLVRAEKLKNLNTRMDKIGSNRCVGKQPADQRRVPLILAVYESATGCDCNTQKSCTAHFQLKIGNCLIVHHDKSYPMLGVHLTDTGLQRRSVRSSADAPSSLHLVFRTRGFPLREDRVLQELCNSPE